MCSRSVRRMWNLIRSTAENYWRNCASVDCLGCLYVQVCWDAKVVMGATVQRIQPESKMPEEEEVAKAPSALPEEEEDDVDPLEVLKKPLGMIPFCGAQIYDKLDELVNSA